MCIVRLAVIFGYYLILMLVNTFTDVYHSALTSSAADILGYIISVPCLDYFGIKKSQMFCCFIATVGGITILSWGLNNQDSIMFFIIFLVTKFGISFGFNVVYCANARIFPTLFATTAIGICNFVGRSIASTSFLMSQ